jgi:hypothetical protein
MADSDRSKAQRKTYMKISVTPALALLALLAPVSAW